MGMAKALVDDPGGGSFVERGVRVLRDGGCSPVVVVVGAEAERATALANGAGADLVVEASDWASGQSASLRRGIEALQTTGANVVCVLLVDLPDVGADVAAAVLGAAGDGPAALGRAAYQGVPGHPVVIGRDHWAAIRDEATGDRGARDYLASHPHASVEVGHLASGRDADTPDDLRTPHDR
ncbi:nucleotidyltransferase family protein [Pedococcus bigeumensis]|uniref:Nucleotidyltransferase family protein n=2 Tax=Pedococcus bigeumensis TaxID=433644 RepID=A0A502CK60_9MICO|nr:nucleotidyltransferase family protein [Pedococcus bigeumensis]